MDEKSSTCSSPPFYPSDSLHLRGPSSVCSIDSRISNSRFHKWTRCHQRPRPGWQIELGGHTHTHTHLTSLLQSQAAVLMIPHNPLHRAKQEIRPFRRSAEMQNVKEVFFLLKKVEADLLNQMFHKSWNLFHTSVHWKGLETWGSIKMNQTPKVSGQTVY